MYLIKAIINGGEYWFESLSFEVKDDVYLHDLTFLDNKEDATLLNPSAVHDILRIIKVIRPENTYEIIGIDEV